MDKNIKAGMNGVVLIVSDDPKSLKDVEVGMNGVIIVALQLTL